MIGTLISIEILVNNSNFIKVEFVLYNFVFFKMGYEYKRERARKIAEIMDNEAGEIVKELKRKQSSISKEEIVTAGKKRQDKIRNFRRSKFKEHQIFC